MRRAGNPIRPGQPVAHLVAAQSETVDFVPQFRARDRAHDYTWEERWIRDEDYMKIVPRAIGALLEAAGIDAASVTAFCLPCTLSRVVPGVAKRLGIADGPCVTTWAPCVVIRARPTRS